MHDVLEHESVGLRLRQRIGALLVHRVLGRDHQERLGDRVLDARDGGLPLLHRLEHGALRLGAGAVDLVEQHDVGVHRAELGDERVRRRLVDLGADDVAGQQVRRALDALKAAVDGFGDDAGGGGLGQAGNALDQEVPAGEQADQQRFAQFCWPTTFAENADATARRCAALRRDPAGRAANGARSSMPFVGNPDPAGIPHTNFSHPRKLAGEAIRPPRKCSQPHENGPRRILRGPFYLVAGTGFEPATSGL